MPVTVNCYDEFTGVPHKMKKLAGKTCWVCAYSVDENFTPTEKQQMCQTIWGRKMVVVAVVGKSVCVCACVYRQVS